VTPEQVTAELAGDLPSATLVLGPGAWELLKSAGAMRPEWLYRWDLDASCARVIRSEAWRRAPGAFRVNVLQVDGTSAQVQNMLLKVLEEPPGCTKFVLAATVRPLSTVVSRCRVLVLGQEAVSLPADSRDKAAVATALRAARSGQAALLAQTLRNWLPVQAKLLSVWAAEAVSGQWQVFDAGIAPGVSTEQAMRLLTELARYPGAKIGTLVALEAVFSPG
jgi:hypothetical protein